MTACGGKPGTWVQKVKNRLTNMFLDDKLKQGDKKRALRLAEEMV